MQLIFGSTAQPDPHGCVDPLPSRAAPEPVGLPFEEGITDKSYHPFTSSNGSLTDMLTSMPLSTRNACAARARKERDDAFQVIAELPCLPKEVKKYLHESAQSIHRQEMRWQLKSHIPIPERVLFWLWLVIMQAAVVVPDIVSASLGAEVAVLRSGPITLQTQLMVLAILDFPWADTRLAAFLACEVFLGGLPAVIFGLLAISMPHARTTFHSAKDVAWKASFCILWQMLMQNRKNIKDLLKYSSLRMKRIAVAQRPDFTSEYTRLRNSSTIIYSWLDTFDVSNRLRVQIGYHKQDHEDVLRVLRWVGHITDDKGGNPRGRKVGILVAILAMAVLICLSTFPTDPYSGLIAAANLVPLAARAAVDVMDKSQSSHDLLRLFTATAGVSFPSTLFVVGNSCYWLLKKKSFLDGFSSIQFWLSFVLIFFLSLFPKIWGKLFMYLGSRCMNYR
ncbi:C protein [Agrobacterium vitis]|nr:C protein [Agrobacterium vitis]